MRFGSVIDDRGWLEVTMRDDQYLLLETGDRRLDTIRGIAGGGAAALDGVRAWVENQPAAAWRPLSRVEEIGPPVEPDVIFTIGANYRTPGDSPGQRPARPLVYGKAATSISGHAGLIDWDRTITDNVDAECELGIVIGTVGRRIEVADAMRHVFGYTVVNDVSSRDAWLDGDQWFLGKSMHGFCPIGPWIVTSDEVTPDALRLGCTINGTAIQDGNTADMRFSVAEIVSFLSRHLTLMPGDLIATGTPPRLDGPLGPGRHLQSGDRVTAWIEHIGELTTDIV